MLVEARAVAAEDAGLHRAVGRAERREAVFLLHVLGDLEPAQRLDLPLRRAGPQRVGAPDDMVGAEALDERAHDERAKARLGGRGPGEDLPEIAVDVSHSVLLWDLGEVVHPLDAPGALPLRPAFGGRGAADPA